nr:MAG TPA: hypothetical protein [Caudoviricetes sp.]
MIYSLDILNPLMREPSLRKYIDTILRLLIYRLFSYCKITKITCLLACY